MFFAKIYLIFNFITRKTSTNINGIMMMNLMNVVMLNWTIRVVQGTSKFDFITSPIQNGMS